MNLARTDGKVYYWPRRGEDLATVSVFAPALETLVKVEGALDEPVTNIEFNGITFAHTAWLRPSEQGHVPLQASMPMLNAKKLSSKGTPYHPGLDNRRVPIDRRSTGSGFGEECP